MERLDKMGVILSQSLSTDSELNFDTTSLKDGLYFIKVIQENRHILEKFIILKH